MCHHNSFSFALPILGTEDLLFPDEGEEIQDELAGITGSHTVPQVFIKGEFVGGCDGKPKPFCNTVCAYAYVYQLSVEILLYLYRQS